MAKQPVQTTEKSSLQDGLQTQLQSLLKQKKYRQALEKVQKAQPLLKQKKYRQALEKAQKAQRSQPDLKIPPSEAEI